MDEKIYLRLLYGMEEIPDGLARIIGRNPCYDLAGLPSPKLKEEIEGFIRYRSTQVSIGRMQGDKQFYNKVRRFLKECATAKSSLRDKAPETWVKQFRTWMFKEHIPLYYRSRGPTGKENISKAREIGYFERMLKFTAVDARREEEKDVWELDKLEIEHRENPIKRVRTLNFTRISQDGIRQELKKGIYLNLQGEAIACVQKELTAARRLSRYLADRYPQVQSCRDLNREIIEEYLTYLKTEATGTKHYHADLNRLRSLLESTGQMCDYPNLIGLFLTRDIPPTPKAAFKTYSDAELKRLNREIVKLDAQTARLMIIHQMLGARISDTLTLTPDCLSERNGEIIIRIRQMKTKPYEKPISAELAALIKKAIAYTKEKYGDTTYIFVDEKNPSRPMPYTTVQFRITDMIYKKELRDDNGEIFGFGTHIYRHYYGMKLTEMHLDDWTIAKLLGHSSVRNVKYYRKMSNQLLADETRKARQRLSAVILDNLDGWEAEYEQIRQALRKAEDKESFIEYLEREGYQVRWSANRKHITFITPEGYRCRDSSLHDETFLKDNLEYLFLYRQLTNFQLGGEEPLYGWLYGVTYNAEALTRYLEQAMDVPEPPPIPVWTESKQRQREALKKLAHGQRLENIESFEEDEGYDFGMSM